MRHLAAIRALSLVVLTLFVFVAPASAQASRVEAARIVSTSPSITETLFALGLGDRVVGVSTWCRYPEAAQRLPKIGTFLRPEPEAIARLHPDLVLVHPGPNDVTRQMQAIGVRAVAVEQGALADVFTSIRTVGRAAGVPARADALVRDLQVELDAVRQSVAGQPRKKVLIIIGRRPGTLSDLMAAGRGSYLNDLVEIAGGVNVLSDPRLPEFPRISMETVVRLDPDLIVEAGDMGDAADERQPKAAQALSLWRAQPHVRAVGVGGVHPVVSDAFVVPGPRLVDVATTFAQWMHGTRP